MKALWGSDSGQTDRGMGRGATGPTHPILRLEHIVKRFPGVIAVDDVTLDLAEGQVHALVGENGAGKTTLMNIVYGVHQPDAGRILLDGREIIIRRPADAIRSGIALVHQHFKLVPSFTVAENLMMVRHHDIDLIPDYRAFGEEVEEIAERYGLTLNPKARILELPLGLRQRVEILAGLIREARILILDEPTTVLAPPEVEDLFGTLRRIADEGKAVVLITHRLTEVFEVGDVFSVMRAGRLVASDETRESSPRQVAEMMVGQALTTLEIPKNEREPQSREIVLRAERLTLPPDEASPGLHDVTFELRRGEILAVAGVEGNGQRELVEVLAGIRQPTEGHVWLDGHEITGTPRKHGAELGLGLIPEDRHAEGLILAMTLTENVAIDRLRRPEFSRAGLWLLLARLRRFARRMIDEYHIRASSEQVTVKTLSGGNQQRVVLARVLSSDPAVLIAARPTRGLDIAATRYILEQLLKARSKGRGVLFISHDLDQIQSLADRILVLYRGQVAAVLDAATTSRDEIGVHMTGASLQPTGTYPRPAPPGD